MLTKLSQFYSILATHRYGFSAKHPGTRKGTIRRGGETPAEVVYRILTGDTVKAQSTALIRLFASGQKRALVGAAADAPNMLRIYERLFISTWKASGKQAALRVEKEWQSVLSVRGQMLKALGIKDPLRGDDRLPSTLYQMKSVAGHLRAHSKAALPSKKKEVTP